MAFGNISTFYIPRPADAGANLWGAGDVRKLLGSIPSNGPDGTTVTDHGTGGAVTRTLDPYSTKATDDTDSNFGWAIAPTDMNSLSGARRFFPAGNHTLSLPSRNITSSTGKSGCQYVFRAYRVASAAAGRGRTLLGEVTGSSFTTANLNAFTTQSVTLALSEVIFDPDETIQYTMEFIASGTAVTGETYAHRMGYESSSGLIATISTPKLGVLADGDLSAAGAVSTSLIGGKVLGGDLSSSAAVAMAAVGGATGAGVVAVTAAATVDAKGSSVATGVMAATAAAVVDAQGSKVLGGVMQSSSGGGTTIQPIFNTFD